MTKQCTQNHFHFTISIPPDRFKTQEMCNEIMCKDPAAFYRIPDHLKAQEMCEEAVEVDP